MTPATSLTQRRERLRISQADLARIAGVHKSTVWRWESGQRRVPHWVDILLDTLEHDQGSMVTSFAWLLKLRASKKEHNQG
jgi:transcriptional regulator with XRE-family HTH domain